MPADHDMAGGFERLPELPVAAGGHEERPVLGADAGAGRQQLAEEGEEHRHRVVVVGVGDGAPRPGAQQGVAGVDRAHEVHRRAVVGDDAGLQVLVGGVSWPVSQVMFSGPKATKASRPAVAMVARRAASRWAYSPSVKGSGSTRGPVPSTISTALAEREPRRRAERDRAEAGAAVGEVERDRERLGVAAEAGEEAEAGADGAGDGRVEGA